MGVLNACYSLTNAAVRSFSYRTFPQGGKKIIVAVTRFKRYGKIFVWNLLFKSYASATLVSFLVLRSAALHSSTLYVLLKRSSSTYLSWHRLIWLHYHSSVNVDYLLSIVPPVDDVIDDEDDQDDDVSSGDEHKEEDQVR